MKTTDIKANRDYLDTSLLIAGRFSIDPPIGKWDWRVENTVQEKIERSKFFERLQRKYDGYCGKELSWKEKVEDLKHSISDRVHVEYEPNLNIVEQFSLEDQYKYAYEYIFKHYGR